MKNNRERHNAIFGQIKIAASKRWNFHNENRKIKDSDLRPYLVITKEKSALTVDVAVAFENGPKTLGSDRETNSVIDQTQPPRYRK